MEKNTEKVWIVIVNDIFVQCHLTYRVIAENEVIACKAVQAKYKSQGWGELDLQPYFNAYRLQDWIAYSLQDWVQKLMMGKIVVLNVEIDWKNEQVIMTLIDGKKRVFSCNQRVRVRDYEQGKDAYKEICCIDLGVGYQGNSSVRSVIEVIVL